MIATSRLQLKNYLTQKYSSSKDEPVTQRVENKQESASWHHNQALFSFKKNPRVSNENPMNESIDENQSRSSLLTQKVYSFDQQETTKTNEKINKK